MTNREQALQREAKAPHLIGNMEILNVRPVIDSVGIQ